MTLAHFFLIFHLFQAPSVVHLVVGEVEDPEVGDLGLEGGEEIETGAVQLVVGKVHSNHLQQYHLNRNIINHLLK